VSNSYQQIYVIVHIICNHSVFLWLKWRLYVTLKPISTSVKRGKLSENLSDMLPE